MLLGGASVSALQAASEISARSERIRDIRKLLVAEDDALSARIGAALEAMRRHNNAVEAAS